MVSQKQQTRQPPEVPSIGNLDQYTIQRIAELLPTQDLVQFSRTSRHIREQSTKVMEQRRQNWRSRPIEEFARLPNRDIITDLTVLPDGQILFFSASTGLILWNGHDRPQHLTDLPDHSQVRAISPDGVLIAYTDSQSQNYIINRNTRQTIKVKIDARPSGIDKEVFSFDHRLFVNVTDNNKEVIVSVVPMVDGHIIYRFKPEHHRSTIFSLSPNNHLLAYFFKGYMFSIYLRNLSTRNLTKIDLPRESVSAINFSHDGRILVIGTANRVYLYDIVGSWMASHPVGGRVTECAFSPDDAFLAVGILDQGVLLLRPQPVN
jgi:WD40 repeat protein